MALSVDKPATMYYTLDGARPTVESAVYSVPLTVTKGQVLGYMAADVFGNASEPVFLTS